MIRYILLLLLIGLVYWSCENTKEESTIIISKVFGGSDSDFGKSVQQTTDGGYIITGWINSFGNVENDVWLIKTDSEGNTEPYSEK